MFLKANNDTAVNGTESCLVEPQWYGPCQDEKDPTFGYDRGEPCLLFKLNRIYDWTPEPFTNEEWETAAGEDGKIPKALAKYVVGLTGGGSRKKREADNGNVTDGGSPPPSGGYTFGTDEFTAEQAKTELAKYIFVWCDGEFDYDRESLGSIQYYPGPFIPAAFFPFKGQKNYQSPFIMLQLKRPMPGAMVSIVCQAYAKNIKPDRETGVGYARFQVMIG